MQKLRQMQRVLSMLGLIAVTPPPLTAVAQYERLFPASDGRTDTVGMRVIRFLSVFALCFAYLFSPWTAQAQQPEYVTASNITSFAIHYSNKSASAVACRAKGSERTLGRLTLGGRPSPIAIGALFVPLSPTISQQEARLRKQVNTELRVLSKSTSERAKKQARRRLKQAQSELAQLSAFTDSCATFVPAPPAVATPNAPLPANPYRPDGSVNSPSQPGRSPDTPSIPDGSVNNPINPRLPSATPEPQFFVDDTGEGATHTCSPAGVKGTVSGGGSVIVTLANDSFVQTQDASSGKFSFLDVPAGDYTLFAETEGASFGAAHNVLVRAEGSCEGISLVRKELPEMGAFAFRWRQQESLTSGLEQYTKVSAEGSMAAVASATLNPSADALKSSAADELLSKHRITLDSTELVWGSEHAERLQQTLDGVWPTESGDSPITRASRWVLTSAYLPNDIQFSDVNGALQVRINAEAFRYGALTPAVLDGVRGRFFSERLTLAAVRFLSRDGRDRGALEQILTRRFNTTVVNDLNFACSLTYQTTNDCAESFQLFSNEELLQILPALAQLPSSSDQQQMLYLLRRKNGVRHPVLALDGAKIIPYTDKRLAYPYVEFSREAFLPLDSTDFQDPTQPIKEIILPGVIAANASLLWDRILSEQLKEAWITQTEWSKDPVTRRWINDNLTEVGVTLPVGVLDHSPRGDFATSVTKYITAPEELKFRSSRRYEFLKLYVMHGLRYSRQFREDLKFPVLNLRPDFYYPGKIKEAEVIITGAAEADKNLRMKITLEGNDPLEHGASVAYLTLKRKGTSDIVYVYLYPERPDPVYGTSLVLKANQAVSKYLRGGFYELTSIGIMDTVGNMTIQNPNSIGLKFYLNNSLVPPSPAELEPGSVKLSITETIAQGVTVPMFTTEFKVINPESLTSVSDVILNLDTPTVGLASNPIARRVGNTVRISRPVSPFMPSDRYGVARMDLMSPGTSLMYAFSLDGGFGGNQYLPMPLVEFENENGDVEAPEVDLSSVQVTAQTLAPEKPNGATKVVVKMKAKDNLSGLQSMTYCLRSPLDRGQCSVFNLNLQTAMLPEGTTELKEYEGVLFLPAGSAPGSWGVSSLTAIDRVGNAVQHDLTEIVKFIVDNSSAQ